MDANIGEPVSREQGWRARWQASIKAASLHLGLSAAVAACVAALVFALWYPMPYREVSGGRELFLLVAAVDVVIGPLLTLAVFDRRKPRAELLRDLGVIVLLQVAALGYGLNAVAKARPALVALEGDRLRVIRAIELEDIDLGKAPAGMRTLSWLGPTLVATRPPRESEKLEAIQRGLAGEDIGMRPDFWLPAEQTREAFAQAAVPLDRLFRMRPERKADLDRAVAATSRSEAQLGYLPILARRTDWSALVDRSSGEIVGYVDVEGF
jgi:hypothetical protein